MDVRISEHEKRIIRLGVNLFRKKIGKKASKKNITKYLRQSNDKALNEILDYIDFISGKTKSDYQNFMLKEYAEFGLFLAINHPTLKTGLEGLLKEYTKYDDINIDLKPCLSRVDKYLFEQILKYIIKCFSSRRTYNVIMSESIATSNKLARYFMANIDHALVDVRNDFMQRALKTLLWFGVWVGINDTAWRHQFYYVANKCGNETLKEISKEFYHEPDEWFINLYQEGVDATRKLWDANEIPRHKTSLLEAPCVVENQQKVIKKYNKEHGVVE